ncbi:hypothetical protein Ddc_07711 [Ditylenchus destructor]|nr:hypothetical protein Ddc_07711 [Ditylenchus destructor]
MIVNPEILNFLCIFAVVFAVADCQNYESTTLPAVNFDVATNATLTTSISDFSTIETTTETMQVTPNDTSIIPNTSTDNPPEGIAVPSNTPSATPSNTPSEHQINSSEISTNLESYSSGLTPELMRLLDEPMERAESIPALETNYAVAFPRIEVPPPMPKSPDRTQTVNNDVQKQDDQLKLETVLRDISKHHNSFMPPKDSYGTMTGHRSQPFGINRLSTTNFNSGPSHESKVRISPLHTSQYMSPNYEPFSYTQQNPYHIQGNQLNPSGDDMFTMQDCCSPCQFDDPRPISVGNAVTESVTGQEIISNNNVPSFVPYGRIPPVVNPQIAYNYGSRPIATTNFPDTPCGKITTADNTVIQLPGGLGTITEKDVDEFVDSLIRRNLQRQEQKNQFTSRNYVNFDPGTGPSMSAPISGKQSTSKAYFTVDPLPPSEASANLNTANQNFHSPPKEYEIPSNEKKQVASSNEDLNLNSHNEISTKVEKKNETGKVLFSPNYKFLYKFGDGNTNDTKTALYHIHQLKTQHPTVVSLQPSTESLHKMMNAYAKDNSLHLIEMPYQINNNDYSNT